MNKEQNYRLLLIEDNPGDARLIEEYLSESVVPFSSNLTVEQCLKAGRKRLEDQAFDLILLDLSLPDSFGLATFEEIEHSSGDTPIIVLTGLDDEEVGVQTVKSGAQDYLVKKDLNAILLSRSISYAIQRNQLQQQLKKNEQHLLEAQRLAHLGNFEQDLEAGVLVWSDELFRIFDMDPEGEEPDFDGLIKMIHPEDRNRTLKAIEKVRQEAEPQYLEVRIHTKSGKEKYIYNIINPIKNKYGEVAKIFGTTHDITERKNAEQQLKEQERRYRMLFQAATDEILVFQVDEQMNPLPFLEVNDTACDMLGYSHNQLLQKTIYDIVAADKEEIDSRIEQIIEETDVVLETRHKTKDGDKIPLEVSARSFMFNGKHTIISIGRNVRERRKLEQQILNVSEQERQRIGRDMHDSLGQMLSGIGLIAQNLAKKLKSNGLPGAEEVQEITDLIKEADQQARTLSRGLVLVNLESNGLDVALDEMVARASKMFKIDIQYQNTSTGIVDDSTKAVHLYRIAQEAINNAVKHGKATSIEINLSSSEDQILLRIQDNGSGFPEPEERSDGMGVRIMQFRSQMIGGNLKINSEKGKGTEITCQVSK